MTGSRRPGLVACILISSAAMLEITMGVCVLKGFSHAALGRLYVSLGIITFLSMHELIEAGTMREHVVPPDRDGHAGIGPADPPERVPSFADPAATAQRRQGEPASLPIIDDPVNTDETVKKVEDEDDRRDCPPPPTAGLRMSTRPADHPPG